MKIYIKIQKDKLLHFIVGFIIQFLLCLIPIKIIELYALIAVAIIASAKELIYDKWMKKGVCDKEDFFATLIGAIALLLTREIIGALFYFL